MNRSILAIIVFSGLAMTTLTYGEGEFKSNLQLGKIIDFGFAKIKVDGISEKFTTPVNSLPTKKTGCKFIVVDTSVISIQEGVQLVSGDFILQENNGPIYANSGSYGKVEVLGKLSNYEATDGAVAYASSPGAHLNVFFEVPKNTIIDKLRLSYKERQGKTP